MNYKLLVSKDAHKDIDEIVDYIADELKNPQAASDFLDDVRKSYLTIIKNPWLYAHCNDEKLQRQGYRKIVVRNYLILYRADEKKKVVYIVRVVYGRRNYSELL
jgi:addiction module RelE/StbE family toxin